MWESILPRLHALLGLAVLILLAWLMSSNRKRFPFRVVIGGLLLQQLVLRECCLRISFRRKAAEIRRPQRSRLDLSRHQVFASSNAAEFYSEYRRSARPAIAA